MRLPNSPRGRFIAQAGGLAAISAVLLVLVLLAALGGDKEGPTPSPSMAVASPTQEPTIAPTPPPTDTSYRLVYQELGAVEDIIWRVVPSDPSQREEVAKIPHGEGLSVEPSLSPDGRLIAYIAVPEGATDPSIQSELYILDLKRQETEQVPVGVDQRFRPLWSPDGRLLYVRSNAPQQVMIIQITVSIKPAPDDPTPEPTRRPTPTREPTPPPDPSPVPTASPPPAPEPISTILKAHISTALTFIPLGFAADGKSLYFIAVLGGTGGGTNVGTYAPATTESIAAAYAAAVAAAAAATASPEPTLPPEPTPVEPGAPTPSPTPQPTPLLGSFVAQLSDQIARDYDLSPDTKFLSYLAQGLVDGQFLLRASIADLGAKTTMVIATDGLPAGDHLRPLWHPDGKHLAVGVLPSSGESGAVALVPAAGGAPSFLPAPLAGFDVPVAWAPDATYLAVTNYSGDSLANLGKERLDLVAPSGQRLTVAEGVKVKVVGWFQGAPSPAPPAATPS